MSTVDHSLLVKGGDTTCSRSHLPGSYLPAADGDAHSVFDLRRLAVMIQMTSLLVLIQAT
jgi:hypothetical protein